MRRQEPEDVRFGAFDNRIEQAPSTSAAPARRSRRINALKSASTIGIGRTERRGNFVGSRSARQSGGRRAPIPELNKKDLTIQIEKKAHIPSSQKELPGTQTRRKSHAPRLLFGVIIVLFFLGLVGFLGYKYVRTEEIAVEGNTTIDAAYIIALSDIKTGTHVFNIDKGLAEAGIESDPYLIYKNIRYTFPNKITIIVEERIAAACFDFFNAYVIIDEDGLILGHQEIEDQPALPLIQGIDVVEFALGAKVRTDDTAKQADMVKLLAAIRKYALTGRIQQIDFSDRNAITMVLQDGTEVSLGQASQFEEKMEWLYNILLTLEEQGLYGGAIDITSIEAPSYVPPTVSITPEEDV